MTRLVPAILLAICCTLGAFALRSWTAPPAAPRTVPRLPTSAPAPTIAPDAHCSRMVVETERFLPEPVHPNPPVGAWPAFRGPTRDSIARDGVPLADRWSAGGPHRLWETPLGDGHGGAAIHGGQVYVLDYDEAARRDTLRCLSLSTGTEYWRASYPVEVKRNHGMSRTVPAVSDKFVVTIGPKCHVMCVDRRTGEFLWGMDLVHDYGASVPLWYTAQCPLLVDDTVVLAPAGKDLLLGVDCANKGEIRWRTPNPDGWTMSHASIMPMQIAGRDAYVYAAVGGIVCVAATGDEAGKILWQTQAWDKRIVAPCPVQLDDTHVFITSGHGAGSALLELAKDGRSIVAVTPIDKSIFACEQQTPVLVDGCLFGVLPKDAGLYREELVCWRPDTGVVWRSGPERRFGLGSWMVADGKIYLLDDRGTLTMLRASAAGYQELGRARILDGRDAWAPLAVAGKYLVLRDATRMVCLDMGTEH